MAFGNYRPKSALAMRFGNETRKAGDVWYGGYTPSSKSNSSNKTSESSLKLGVKDSTRNYGSPTKESEAAKAEQITKAAKAEQITKAAKVSEPLVNGGFTNDKSPQPVTYDEDQYRYYKSDFGTGVGAEAYATDMENFNNFAVTHADNPHLGLVTQMMHPDWGRSQRAGGGAEAPAAQDYASLPDFAPGSKQAQVFERDFPGTFGGNDGSYQGQKVKSGLQGEPDKYGRVRPKYKGWN
jgi:hypothetical protein